MLQSAIRFCPLRDSPTAIDSSRTTASDGEVDRRDEPPPNLRDARLGLVLLGQFRVLRRLAQGSFGTTYLAEQAHLHGTSEVVVKFLRMHARTGSSDGRCRRFIREAAMLARLDHAHLPRLLASGALDGELFLVMQKAGDCTLKEVMNDGAPLALSTALRIAMHVCGALVEAHRVGLVHRDVKPENILLTFRSGRPWARLIDVGAAKLMSDSEIEDPSAGLTHERCIIGTPAYISPEQASGASIDGRSDVYSLSCVLFEMVSGSLPFAGTTQRELLRARLLARPRTLAEVGVLAPRCLQKLLAKGLQLDPGHRFQSAAELRSAVAEVSASLDPDRAAPRLWSWGLKVMCVVAAVTAGFLLN